MLAQMAILLDEEVEPVVGAEELAKFLDVVKRIRLEREHVPLGGRARLKSREGDQAAMAMSRLENSSAVSGA
jgi:hypothetical protein